MSNPFEGVGRTIQRQRLKGRERELRWLVERLQNREQNINLVGFPRIGKTSLVHVARAELRISQNEPTCTFSMSNYTHAWQVFQDLLTKTIQEWERAGNNLNKELTRLLDTSCTDSYSAYSRCCEGMRVLARNGARSLWVIDEFDAIATARFSDGQEAILRLRELLYHTEDYRTTGLIVSRRRIQYIEEILGGVSNFHGIVSPKSLGPLDRSGVAEIVSRAEPEWKLSSADQERLWHYTGGNPYLTETILYRSWDGQALDSGEEEFLADIRSYYDGDIRRFCEEAKIFGALIRVCSGPRWDVPYSQFDMLKQLGLVSSKGEPFSAHFGEYIERCVFETNNMDLWRRAEMGVRDLVDEVASSLRGPMWLENLSGKVPFAKMRTDAEQRKAKAEKSFGSGSARLVDYLYPKDLWEIIQFLWQDCFSQIFPPSSGGGPHLGGWRDRFELFSQVRTPIAHHWDTQLPRTTLLKAQSACEEILEVVKQQSQNAKAPSQTN